MATKKKLKLFGRSKDAAPELEAEPAAAPKAPAKVEATPAPATASVPAAEVTSSGDPHSLSQGDTGEQVEALQDLLNGKGFRLQVNGDFSLWVTNALKDYQGRVGLPRTGVADAATLAALNE